MKKKNFLGSSIFHSFKNAIFKTACQKIEKSWVNDTQPLCNTGLAIKFLDNSNTERSGFLTKYFGIISDNAPMESCLRESQFTLPTSTLVRKKNKVVKIPNELNPSVYFLSSNKYNFFGSYNELYKNGSLMFFRDLFTFLILIIIFFFLFGKKRCVFFLKNLFNKIFKQRIDFDSESEYQIENYGEKFNDIDIKMIELKLELERVQLTLNEKKNEQKINKEINNVYLDLLDSDSLKIRDLENILQKKKYCS